MSFASLPSATAPVDAPGGYRPWGKGLTRAGKGVCVKADLPVDEPAALASATEFVLESLYVNNRLSKYTYQGNTFYKR